MAFERRRASAAATVAVIIGLGLATSPTRILSALSGCGGGCQDDSQCGEGRCCGGSCFTTTASCSGKPGPPMTIYYYACSF